MESLTELANSHIVYWFPVAIVFIFLGLYKFGIRKTVQPAFDQLSQADDRKPAGKKRKTKEKVIIQIFIFILLPIFSAASA